MNKIGWPMVALGELLKRVKRRELVEPSKTYDVLGAHWYAKGLYTKHSKPGSQIRAKDVYRVEQGDFVYNRLFAWKGSFAIATQENDGCHVSNEFPCFVVDRERLDGQYLWYYFSRASAWNEALGLSSGGTPTSRNRLKEARLLAMHIPLPPLAEQRRIVARIEELAAKVEAAQALRQQAVEEAERLVGCALEQIILSSEGLWNSASISQVAEVNPSRQGWDPPSSSDMVSFVPMRAVDDLTGTILWPETSKYEDVKSGYKWFVDGDVIFARITPCMQNGKAAIARDLVNGVGFGSTEFIVIRPGPEVSSEWIHAIVRLRGFRKEATEHFKGTAGQQRVPPDFVKRKVVPVPPIPEQRRIVAYLDDLQAKVDAVKQHQAATTAALDALLPSILDRAFRGEL